MYQATIIDRITNRTVYHSQIVHTFAEANRRGLAAIRRNPAWRADRYRLSVINYTDDMTEK